MAENPRRLESQLFLPVSSLQWRPWASFGAGFPSLCPEVLKSPATPRRRLQRTLSKACWRSEWIFKSGFQGAIIIL